MNLFTEENVEFINFQEIKHIFFGYSSLYIDRKWNNEKKESSAKVEVYKQLVAIDKQLGSNPADLLIYCCAFGQESLIKVTIYHA